MRNVRGLTSCFQVHSPLSNSILGEQTLVVSEEKVTVTELHTQVVAGLSLSLQTQEGHPGVVTATALGTPTLRALKQVRWVGGITPVSPQCPPNLCHPSCHPPGSDTVHLAVLLRPHAGPAGALRVARRGLDRDVPRPHRGHRRGLPWGPRRPPVGGG